MESQEQGPVRVVNLSEADIVRVGAEVDPTPEGAPEEARRESVRQALVTVLPKPIPAAAAQPASAPASAGADARVQELLAVAVSDGIDAAHAAALTEEPYVLDALHDALTGSLYEELQSRGQL